MPTSERNRELFPNFKSFLSTMHACMPACLLAWKHTNTWENYQSLCLPYKLVKVHVEFNYFSNTIQNAMQCVSIKQEIAPCHCASHREREWEKGREREWVQIVLNVQSTLCWLISSNCNKSDVYVADGGVDTAMLERWKRF